MAARTRSEQKPKSWIARQGKYIALLMGAVQLAGVYVLVSLAINSGSWLEYTAAAVLLYSGIGSIVVFIKAVRASERKHKATQA